MNTPVIGITGGIGSGKSAATDYFTELGIDVVDADIAARTIVETGTMALKAIAEHFGNEVLQDDGSLNRAALRSIVFNDAKERQWLESLTHPLIAQEIQQQLKQAHSPYVVFSSPLLLETAQHQLCDQIIVVDVPEATQLQRTMERDHNDATQVQRIMAAQIPRSQRLEKADSILDNGGSIAALHAQVDVLHAALLRQYAEE